MHPQTASAQPTLRQFLRLLFPGVPAECLHLCGFPGDPSDAANPDKDWTGVRFAHLARPFPDNWNQYFCIGVLSSSSTRRSAANVIDSPVLALDDIGTKVKPELVRNILGAAGLHPAVVIETSPANYSLFYQVSVADHEDSVLRLQALRGRLSELGLTDPACVDPCRYMRLPSGRNGKNGWLVRLRTFRPQVTRYEDWARVLWSSESAEQVALSGARRSSLSDERFGALDDPIVQLAAIVGLDPREVRPGVIEADCPFGDEHSRGDLSGFAFINWGRCKCHHGHCATRRSPDFIQKMVELYDQQIALGLLDGSYMPLSGSDTMVVDQAGHRHAGNGLTLLTQLTMQRMASSTAALRRAVGEPPPVTRELPPPSTQPPEPRGHNGR